MFMYLPVKNKRREIVMGNEIVMPAQNPRYKCTLIDMQ